jgi:hypothetical protein
VTLQERKDIPNLNEGSSNHISTDDTLIHFKVLLFGKSVRPEERLTPISLRGRGTGRGKEKRRE